MLRNEQQTAGHTRAKTHHMPNERLKAHRLKKNWTQVYVATMNLMRPTWEQNNLERLQDLLASMQDNPARGWEWDFWNRMAHLETATSGTTRSGAPVSDRDPDPTRAADRACPASSASP